MLMLKKKGKEYIEGGFYDVSDFVGEEEFPMMEKALEFFEKTNFGMSEIQIKNFVLNRVDFPTTWSRYKQGKMELWIRFCSIMDDYFNFQTAKANIELENAKIAEEYSNDSLVSRAKIKLSEIEIEKNRFKIEVMQKSLKDKLKEMEILYREVTEDEKNIHEDEKEEDKKFWNEKIKKNPGIFSERYEVQNV